MRPWCSKWRSKRAGGGTTHAGADAAETSRQPVETERGPKAGTERTGSTHGRTSCEHRRMDGCQSNLPGRTFMFLLLELKG